MRQNTVREGTKKIVETDEKANAEKNDCTKVRSTERIYHIQEENVIFGDMFWLWRTEWHHWASQKVTYKDYNTRLAEQIVKQLSSK